MLTPIQKKILDVIKQNRGQETLVAGGTALNYDTKKLSMDIDIFNCNLEICEQSFAKDIKALQDNNFEIHIESVPGKFGIGNATVRKDGKSTKMQWVMESAWRFFPAEEDDIFGYRLNFYDLVINKLLCLVDRQYPRDFADIALIMDKGVSLSACMTGIYGKDPCYNPSTFAEIVRTNLNYAKKDFNLVAGNVEIDWNKSLAEFKRELRNFQNACEYIPAEMIGSLFLDKNNIPFLPSVKEFKNREYTLHSGTMFGSFPQFVQNSVVENINFPVP